MIENPEATGQSEVAGQRIIDEITGVIHALEAKFDAKLDTVIADGQSTNKRITQVEERTAKLEERVGRHSTQPSKPDLEQDAKLSRAIIESREASEKEIAELRDALKKNNDLMAKVDKHLSTWTTNPLIRHSVTLAVVALAGYVALHFGSSSTVGALVPQPPVPVLIVDAGGQ
jgi:chromosome segregation ATPase